MRFFAISITQLVYRYYLMMATVLLALFTGWTALAFLALPVFLSAILGIRFHTPAVKVAAVRRKVITFTARRKVGSEKVA